MGSLSIELGSFLKMLGSSGEVRSLSREVGSCFIEMGSFSREVWSSSREKRCFSREVGSFNREGDPSRNEVGVSVRRIGLVNVGKRVWGLREMQGVKGSWLQARDLRGWGIRCNKQGIAFPTKIFSFSKYQIRTPLILCVFRVKKCSLCRLNHTSGSKTWVYSWYASPHGSKQLGLLQVGGIFFIGGRIMVQSSCIPSTFLGPIQLEQITGKYFRIHLHKHCLKTFLKIGPFPYPWPWNRLSPEPFFRRLTCRLFFDDYFNILCIWQTWLPSE